MDYKTPYFKYTVLGVLTAVSDLTMPTSIVTTPPHNGPSAFVCQPPGPSLPLPSDTPLGATADQESRRFCDAHRSHFLFGCCIRPCCPLEWPPLSFLPIKSLDFLPDSTRDSPSKIIPKSLSHTHTHKLPLSKLWLFIGRVECT